MKLSGNAKYILRLLALLLGGHTILRLAFFFYHYEQSFHLTLGEMFWGFASGLRFDVATILFLNAPLVLLLLLPLAAARKKITFTLANIFILLVNLPALAVNAIDIVYYGFSEKRLTHEFWTTKEDLVNINFTILIGYWHLFIAFGVIVWLLWRLLRRLSQAALRQNDSEAAVAVKQGLALSGSALLLIFIGIRGGTPFEPLGPEKAYLTKSFYAGNLGTNSAWTVICSLDLSKGSTMEMVPRETAIKVTRELIQNSFDGPFVSDEYPLVRKASFEGPERRWNVVIFFIESLNARHVGRIGSYMGLPPQKGRPVTPVLDSLTAHGKLYTNYYSNASRSIESIPSGLNSLPELFIRPTISSRYEQNHNWGIGNMLRARGYHTGFFCPGRTGSMGFDHYSIVSGLDHYYGMGEYPDAEKNYSGLWGCYDGPFLQWMLQKENELRQPFFHVFFSVSNHHPFVLPPGHEDLEDVQGWDLVKTTAYTDRVLGEYLKEARKQPWFDSTIFIITGDHTFHEYSEADRTYMDNFHVPLWIMAPGLPGGPDHRLGSHTSIEPTLIELLRLDTWHASSNVSLVSATDHAYVIENLMEVKGLAMGSDCWTTTFARRQKYFELQPPYIKWAEEEENEKSKQMDFTLRCLYQTFQMVRHENRVIGPEFMAK